MELCYNSKRFHIVIFHAIMGVTRMYYCFYHFIFVLWNCAYKDKSALIFGAIIAINTIRSLNCLFKQIHVLSWDSRTFCLFGMVYIFKYSSIVNIYWLISGKSISIRNADTQKMGHIPDSQHSTTGFPITQYGLSERS